MIQRPKGTKDILPQDTYIWQFIEDNTKQVFKNYGFQEIRVPVFEHTELFERGVGDTTDVVQKEMYTFNDKGGRSITLRPEGTAGVVRAYIENGMASLPNPVKLWYNMSMYRYENVQKGRLREFHQIGAELFGSSSYEADVEVICLAKRIIDSLEIENVKLMLNSIGCPTCRQTYQVVLKEWIADKLDKYCEPCKSRFEQNPMRILDCKEKNCIQLNQEAPVILNYLCKECKEHFEKLKNTLNKLCINYEIDSKIVRGLDYYTKSVFEFIDEKEGLTVLAGGRYDELVKELDGQDIPAIGFAMGMERIVELFKRKETKIKVPIPEIYIAQIGEDANIFATNLVEKLRNINIYAQKDVTGKALKSQFKYADKIGCKYVLTIGETELEKGKANLKDMITGEETLVVLNEIELAKHIEA